MKVRKFENVQNKMGLKGCKWSSLKAPGTETASASSLSRTFAPLLAPQCRVIGEWNVLRPPNVVGFFSFFFTFYTIWLSFRVSSCFQETYQSHWCRFAMATLHLRPIQIRGFEKFCWSYRLVHDPPRAFAWNNVGVGVSSYMYTIWVMFTIMV